MIVPIPFHEIAFREIAARKNKLKSTLFVTSPGMEAHAQVTVPNGSSITTDVKSSNTFNNILTITIILAVVGVTIYLVDKHIEKVRMRDEEYH